MATYHEHEWLSVRQVVSDVAQWNISEPALRKAMLRERLEKGSGIKSHHFSGIYGVLVSKASLKEFVDRTRPDGIRPKGRPRTRPASAPHDPSQPRRGRGRPPKLALTEKERQDTDED